MLIDGKKIAAEMLAKLTENVALRQTQGESLRLAAVLVGPSTDSTGSPQAGSGQASRKFLELKRKAAEKVGIDFRLYEFDQNITSQKLRKEVVSISKAGVNHGVMVELPLLSGINTQYILNAIPQKKDVDVLSEKSQGSFFVGRSPILPPAVDAVKIILAKNNINLQGKTCTVFGYGLLVGRPISHWLASQGATVNIINEFTLDPGRISREADIVISGVGKANLVKSDMIKEGAVVIDFGYENYEGKAVGDIDFEAVSKKASLITPVPGGVGPIVIAAVLSNLVTLVNKNLKTLGE